MTTLHRWGAIGLWVCVICIFLVCMHSEPLMMPNIQCYELYGHQKHQVFNSDTTCFYVSDDHVAQMSCHSELFMPNYPVQCGELRAFWSSNLKDRQSIHAQCGGNMPCERRMAPHFMSTSRLDGTNSILKAWNIFTRAIFEIQPLITNTSVTICLQKMSQAKDTVK